MKLNRLVNEYLSQVMLRREAMSKLRMIILGCGLTEELKWGKPCYTFQGKNIVIMQGFKAYCALLFFKGVLLKDPNDILKKTGENAFVGRQIRFARTQDVVELKPMVIAYIHEAIEVEKAGLKVEIKGIPKPIPEEFQKKMDEDPALKAAFEGLTPGRQRAYVFYFSAPKQSKTRESRVIKCMRQILNGKGLNDEYLARQKH